MLVSGLPGVPAGVVNLEGAVPAEVCDKSPGILSKVWKDVASCADCIGAYKKRVFSCIEKYGPQLQLGQTALLVSLIGLVILGSSIGILPISLSTAGALILKSSILNICQFLLPYFLEKFSPPQAQDKKRQDLNVIVKMAQGSLFITCLFFPVCEEIIFRKLLPMVSISLLCVTGMGYPVARTITSLAVSILFAVVHMPNYKHWARKLTALSAAFLGSYFILFPAYYAGGLFASIFVHAVGNVIITTAMKMYLFLFYPQDDPQHLFSKNQINS